MLTFKAAQDAVIERFNAGRRNDVKEWIRFVHGQVWGLDEWTFKQALSPATVTTNSNILSGLPGNVGVVHLLQNAQGAPLTYRDWKDFQRLHFGETGLSVPYDYTVVGAGRAVQILVGPKSSETSSAYQLSHEYDPGFYPSTTLTDAQTTLPAATLNVADATVFPTAGTVLIAGRPVAYTGKTGATALTGCTGGAGTFAATEPVVCLAPTAGDLSGDTDVSMLPFDFHQILVHGAQAIGQTGENDYSMYLSDDRVQQGLDAMRRRYLVSERGETQQWGSQENAAEMDGWAWRP